MLFNKKCFLFFWILFIFVIGCSKEEKIKFSIKENLYIDSGIKFTSFENGAVIPKNHVYLLVEFNGLDSLAKGVKLRIESKSRQKYINLEKNSCVPGKNILQPFLQDGKLKLSIYYQKEKKPYRSKKIELNVSKEKLNDKIIFRLVEPLFNASQTSYINLYSFASSSIKSVIKIENTCIGCHGYSDMMDLLNVKKNKDRRLVLKINKPKQKISQKVIGQFSFFSISMNGKYAAIAANTAGKIVLKKQVVEPFNLTYLTGDIFIYDLEKNKLSPLRGASEINYVEDMPFFDSENKKLVFSRYQVKDEEIISMDLYSVDFNNGKGGKAMPIKNASHNGKYHYFAKYSPDGKWLSFCRGDGKNGIFSRKTSDIFLLNLKNNHLRKMNLNLSEVMDSWHYWSSDSKWMIFSSNRGESKLAELYMVYIDESGFDYPPIKLAGYDKFKVNIPQFINENYSVRDGKRLNSFIKKIYNQN